MDLTLRVVNNMKFFKELKTFGRISGYKLLFKRLRIGFEFRPTAHWGYALHKLDNPGPECIFWKHKRILVLNKLILEACWGGRSP